MDKELILKIQQAMLDTTDLKNLVEQFIDHDKRHNRAKDTIKTRQTHLKQFYEFCTIVGITDIHMLSHQLVDIYFTEYSKTHAISTTNTGRRILKVFLRWVQGYKEVDIPLLPDAISLDKEEDTLPKALERSTIEYVIKHTEHLQDALMISVCTEAGLRISELVKLTAKDVHFDDLHIHGKGAVERTVHITDHLASALRQFLRDADRTGDDFVFQNVLKGYRPLLTINTARLRIQRCFKEIAGIDMYPHQLRHTYAIELLMSGCDIRTIQQLMGHKDIVTTQVYLRLLDKYVKNNYKKYIGKSVFE